MSIVTVINARKPQILQGLAAYARRIPALQSTKEPVLLGGLDAVIDAVGICATAQGEQWRLDMPIQGCEPVRDTAKQHGICRAISGVRPSEMLREFSSLRAQLLQLFDEQRPPELRDVIDVARFDHVFDYAAAESLASCEAQLELWRRAFLAVLAHDLRSPLQALSLGGMLISRGVTGALAADASAFTSNVSRVSQTLDSLLALHDAGLQVSLPIDRQWRDLSLACRAEAAAIAQAVRRPSSEIVVVGDLSGRFDEVLVRQAFKTLLTAVTTQTKRGDPVHVALTGNSSDVRISIAQAGRLTERQRATLAEPIASGEDLEEVPLPLSLALFVCRRIAWAHGGDVEVQTADAGTEFCVILPR